MSTSVPGFIDQISSPRAPAVVIPAEEAAKDAGKINLIGTGPYQFVDFQPDAFVKLKRFDGYVPNTNYPARDGFGGKKTAYFDTITIKFMPEGGARAAALQTGEVQILEALTTPDGKRLATDKSVKVYEMMPWAFQTIMLNANVAPTNNVKVREAMQVALDMEEIMAISTDGLYRMTQGWQHPGTSYFAGDIGKEFYNLHDTARAKTLLAEAGYKGEPGAADRQQLQEPPRHRRGRGPAAQRHRHERPGQGSRLADRLQYPEAVDRLERLDADDGH
jgi:peptide/nickel transport system substrate-binding protein